MNVPRGREGAGGGKFAVVAVRVVPRASREEVAGFTGEAVRIRLTAPPVENRANEALLRFFSRALGIPRGEVSIVAGGLGRRKLVRVEGLTREECLRRLGLDPPPA